MHMNSVIYQNKKQTCNKKQSLAVGLRTVFFTMSILITINGTSMAKLIRRQYLKQTSLRKVKTSRNVCVNLYKKITLKFVSHFDISDYFSNIKPVVSAAATITRQPTLLNKTEYIEIQSIQPPEEAQLHITSEVIPVTSTLRFITAIEQDAKLTTDFHFNSFSLIL